VVFVWESTFGLNPLQVLSLLSGGGRDFFIRETGPPPTTELLILCVRLATPKTPAENFQQQRSTSYQEPKLVLFIRSTLTLVPLQEPLRIMQ